MFKSFQPRHEALVERFFGSGGPLDPAAWADLARALEVCRTQVVDGLKAESQAELRLQLRLLYEGLTSTVDFLMVENLDKAHTAFHPKSGETVPAVRDSRKLS